MVSLELRVAMRNYLKSAVNHLPLHQPVGCQQVLQPRRLALTPFSEKFFPDVRGFLIPFL